MFEQLKHMPAINGLLRRPPLLYAAARRELAHFDQLGAQDKRAYQDSKIAAVLKSARKLSGYASASGGDELSSWPISTKTQICGRERDFVATSLLPHVPASTGGTTGQPMALSRSWANIAMEQAVIDHLCAKAGIDARSARVGVLRGDSFKSPSDMNAPFWIDEGHTRRIFSAHHLNTKTIHHYKAALQSFQPEILFCYPSSLANLLALIEDDCSLHIPLIFASSEVMPRNVVARARACFGADVIDFYGHAERLVCAWSLNGEGFRFIPAYGKVELVPAGEGLARLVATSLSDSSQIFVRYDTGDLVRVPSHDPEILNAIAMGEMAFDRIDGRDNEYVDLPDGRRIIGLNHIPRGVTGAVSIQIFRSAPWQIGLYIVPGKDFGPASMDKLMANVRLKFPPDVTVLPIFVERSVRERNGKAPLLLRAPDPASISQSSQFPNHHLESVI